jgi:hypothetical protein
MADLLTICIIIDAPALSDKTKNDAQQPKIKQYQLFINTVQGKLSLLKPGSNPVSIKLNVYKC